MESISLDEHLVAFIDLCGVILGILGFAYITNELIPNKPLAFFIRIVTPSLIGALFLGPIGILYYYIHLDYRDFTLQGGELFALIGIMIGMFNGIFIVWPPPSRLHFFSIKDCIIGIFISFLIGSVAILILGQTIQINLLNVIVWLVIGGLIAGFWSCCNWNPTASNGNIDKTDEKPYFSILGFMLGYTSTFILGLVIFYISDAGIDTFRDACFLALPGGFAGATLNSIKREIYITYPPFFSFKGGLIGLISAFILGLVLVFYTDTTAGTPIIPSLSGALLVAAFTALGGMLIGTISRFIFWRTHQLDKDTLKGIGAALTALGFVLQLLHPLIILLDIKNH